MVEGAGSEPLEPETEAGMASAEHGYVVLDGPDGVAVTMVPSSAEETGHRLIEAADQARRQGDVDPA